MKLFHRPAPSIVKNLTFNYMFINKLSGWGNSATFLIILIFKK